MYVYIDIDTQGVREFLPTLCHMTERGSFYQLVSKSRRRGFKVE